MPEHLPEWQALLLEQHQLPPAYLVSALKWFAPVAGLIAEHQSSAGRPLLIGVNGSQGSGKTTLCDYLRAALAAEHHLSCVSLSLDDFYLTRDERGQLATSVHPLLRTRGAPGTHDMALLDRTLEKLLAGASVAIPRFDKSVDDRRPESEWDEVESPVDVIMLEGWCLGVTAQPDEALATPCNALEAGEDSDGRWRRYVNSVLRDKFPALYARVDEWIMLKAPSFECVYQWRLEQERKLARRRSGSGIMSDEEIARFIQFYQRLTQHCLQTLPRRVNHLFTLDARRTVKSYMANPGGGV